ncbi:hypothetical protein LOTGIDRAFT_163303, partial [Lottia gigantea]
MAAAIKNFEGKWNMVDSTNFDEYMKAVGVGMVMRKLAGTAKPQQDIKVEGDDKISITTSTTFKSTVIDFSLGKEFEETTGDGRKVKSVCTVDGNTLKHESKAQTEDEPDTTITREFNGNDMIMILKAKDVTCTRKYQR